MRQRTLTLGESSSQEALDPSPRRIAFTPAQSNASLGSPPPLNAQPSQQSLSTLNYEQQHHQPVALSSSPAPTTLDVQTPRQLPDNQLGDSSLYPETPTSQAAPAAPPATPSQQMPQQSPKSPDPPLPTPPPANTPPQESQQSAPQGSPPQQASVPPPAGSPPAPAPNASQQGHGSSASNSDGNGTAPEMVGTMYTDGTYWKLLGCMWLLAGGPASCTIWGTILGTYLNIVGYIWMQFISKHDVQKRGYFTTWNDLSSLVSLWFHTWLTLYPILS